MRISGFGTRTHYRRHIRPILNALPTDIRGDMVDSTWDLPPDWPTFCASHRDATKLGSRPFIYVEHGAGQTYNGAGGSIHHPAHAGGRSRAFDRATLFLCPSERVADAWRERYPSTPAVAVGCPAMDMWHRSTVRPDGPVVGWTWHFDGDVAEETRSALPHYRDHMVGLVEGIRNLGFQLVGHAHPRARGVMDMWAALGVETVENPEDVFAHCSLLIGDNTSLLYEFASLDRPVLVLNAPWYRRTVEHGLRFWSNVPGVQCDHPEDLLAALDFAYADIGEARLERWAAVSFAYAECDGKATERAVDAVLQYAMG